MQWILINCIHHKLADPPHNNTRRSKGHYFHHKRAYHEFIVVSVIRTRTVKCLIMSTKWRTKLLMKYFQFFSTIIVQLLQQDFLSTIEKILLHALIAITKSQQPGEEETRNIFPFPLTKSAVFMEIFYSTVVKLHETFYMSGFISNECKCWMESIINGERHAWTHKI